VEKLSRIVRELVVIEGACASGIASVKTLEGGPPSCDLSYLLPEAKSAVSFAVAIDEKVIPPYLMKKDRLGLEKDYIRANALASGIALHLSNYLRQKGYPSVPVSANLVYRDGVAGGISAYVPDLAHRYLAVRSGVGYMGLSGNILTDDHGSAIILAATVTAAELVPTNPLPVENNYCDDCRLCIAACPSGFMDRSAKTTVSLGGVDFAFSKRSHYVRCDCVCSGYTGLHPSKKWSSWSPGRFGLPEDDDQLPLAQDRMMKAHGKWPPAPGGRYLFNLEDKIRVSCAHCQLVCCRDKGERRDRYNMLIQGGVVVQHDDGSLEAVSPKYAQKYLASLPVDKRALYEDV